MVPRDTVRCSGLSALLALATLLGPTREVLAADTPPSASLFPARGGSISQDKRRALDECLSEAAEDLGFRTSVATGPTPDEEALLRLGRTQWVFQPALEDDGERIRLRLVASTPGSRVLLVRSETFGAAELGLRCASMMRDLVQSREAPAASRPKPAPATPPRAQSPGRPVMAVAGAVYGGYLGYALQRGGGSDDARLAYPMVALGAGIGVGAALLVSDEFNIGAADAWYVTAAGLWPTLSGVMLAEGYGVQPEGERYLFGLAGSAVGLAGATLALSHKDMRDGDAAFTHSGGVVGTLVGGLVDLIGQGRADVTPSLGLGYGSAAGVALAGALVAVWDAPAASDVLVVDLAIALGGLTGAAAFGPLVFSGEERPDATRVWLGSILGGMVLGSGVGYFLVESEDAPAASKSTAKVDFLVSPTFDWTEFEWNGRRHASIVGGLHGIW